MRDCLVTQSAAPREQPLESGVNSQPALLIEASMLRPRFSVGSLHIAQAALRCAEARIT